MCSLVAVVFLVGIGECTVPIHSGGGWAWCVSPIDVVKRRGGQ